MNRVFDLKDEVYHPKHGKGVVASIDNSPRSEAPHYVKFKEGSLWCSVMMLSYEPWPAPVHVKPFKKGWYLYKNNPRSTIHVESLASQPPSHIVLLHYFGTELPKEL